MAEITSRGARQISTKNGTVKINVNKDRILMYDDNEYRFIAGEKPDSEKRVQISNDGINVLDLPS